MLEQAIERVYSMPGGTVVGMGFSFMEAFMDHVEVVSRIEERNS